LETVIGDDLQPLPYPARLATLARHRIGLWDVIASAARPGSLDQSIRAAEHNEIAQMLHDYPDLRAVGFNGSTAASIGRRIIGNHLPDIELIDLPSSSAANTRPFAEKARAWSHLRHFLSP
jgi:hypoxanthine-DNA glycosylase